MNPFNFLVKKPLLLERIQQSAGNVSTSHGCSERKLPYGTFNSTLSEGPMFLIKRAINSRENNFAEELVYQPNSGPANTHPEGLAARISQNV